MRDYLIGIGIGLAIIILVQIAENHKEILSKLEVIEKKLE